jgi:hypothetical protein
VREETSLAFVATKFDITLRTEGRVASNCDSKGLAVRNERLLSEIGVEFDLEDRRLDASIAK